MGVLVFALAIMDNNKNSHLEVMKAEVPGPVFGKVVSKLKKYSSNPLLLVLGLVLPFCGSLFPAGMPLYDSFVIAMGMAGTGALLVFNDGIAHYNSSLITYLVSIGVLVFRLTLTSTTSSWSENSRPSLKMRNCGPISPSSRVQCLDRLQCPSSLCQCR